MRLGLYIPLFDELADPGLVARLAAEAEEAGWGGLLVWDHIRFREPVVDVARTRSRWRRSQPRPSPSGWGRGSPPWHVAGPRRSLARLPRSIGLAAGEWSSAWVSEATSSRRST
jgi:hypothetical protein